MESVEREVSGRPCWICGAPNSTHEHVWPRWLRRVVEQPRGKYRIGLATDPSGWREWTGATFDHTARVLCAACNQRLSSLEARMSVILPGMVDGKALMIAPADQAVIAQWFYKTGLMVSTTNRNDATALPKRHYTELGESFDLPPASSVWIARIDEPAYQAALWVQRFQWWDKELETAPVGEGYFFAMSVANVAGLVMVFDTRQSPESTDLNPFKLGGLGIGRLSKIWPTATIYSVSWPPPIMLTARDFQELADSLQRLAPT